MASRSLPPVLVVHGRDRNPYFIRAGDPLVNSLDYQKHLRRLTRLARSKDPQALDKFVNELRKATRRSDLPSRVTINPSQRCCLTWDFSPRSEYACRFVNTVRAWLASPDPLRRDGGKTARDLIMRLLFESEWVARGPAPHAIDVTAIVADYRNLKPEIDKICAETRSRSERRNRVEELLSKLHWARPRQPSSRAADVSGRDLLLKLFGRPSKVGLAEIVEAILAWKHRRSCGHVRMALQSAHEFGLEMDDLNQGQS
jgi:hypothetical protein